MFGWRLNINVYRTESEINTITAPAPETQTELLERSVEVLRVRIPSTWRLIAEEQYKLPVGRRPDAVLRLIAPDGSEALLLLEAKRVLERRDVLPMIDQLSDLASSFPTAYPLVVGRYLSQSVRAALEKRGTSYIDATGNVRLDLPSPAIYISDRGEDRDPWRSRSGRPRGTLKGAPASRVVRTLLDYAKGWKIRDLVASSGASTGATYRVLEYLQREGLVVRDESGIYTVPNWRELLEAWSRDYGFRKSSATSGFVDPRGLSNLVARAAETTDIRYAFSGSLAAQEWAPYAPPKSAMVYVDNVTQVAEAWGLRPVTAGANVLLAEAESDVVFQRTTIARSGVIVAAAAQVAVDLLTGPGRNPSEGEQLMDWMEHNEPAWRL
jgi:hypothetical protein